MELWECPQRVSTFLSFAWRQGPVRGLNGFPASIEQVIILTSYNKDIMMTSCGRPLRWIRMWPGAWSSR
jgi:hypothetical protein